MAKSHRIVEMTRDEWERAIALYPSMRILESNPNAYGPSQMEDFLAQDLELRREIAARLTREGVLIPEAWGIDPVSGWVVDPQESDIEQLARLVEPLHPLIEAAAAWIRNEPHGEASGWMSTSPVRPAETAGSEGTNPHASRSYRDAAGYLVEEVPIRLGPRDTGKGCTARWRWCDSDRKEIMDFQIVITDPRDVDRIGGLAMARKLGVSFFVRESAP